MPPLNIENLRKLADESLSLRDRIAGLNVVTQGWHEEVTALPDLLEDRRLCELATLANMVETLAQSAAYQQAALTRHYDELGKGILALSQAAIALRGEILRAQGGQQ